MMLCCIAKSASSAASIAIAAATESLRGSSRLVGTPKPPMNPIWRLLPRYGTTMTTSLDGGLVAQALRARTRTN